MILKDKKGLTLVELLICMVMISGISILMYKLLSNISENRKTAEILGNSVIKGSEITATLEQLIYNVELEKIEFSEGRIKFYVPGDSSPYATISYMPNEEINVYNFDASISKKWTFSGASIDMCSTVTDSTANAIDIYLILKEDDEVIGTIEFPYYNSNAFSITASDDYTLNKCGAQS